MGSLKYEVDEINILARPFPMMRFPFSIVFAFFCFILLGFSVAGVTTSMVNHRVEVDAFGIVPFSDFTPLLVRQASVQKEWLNEKGSFLRARKDFADAFDSEKSLLREQLALQRINLLHAYLNGLVVDFQQADYLIGEFPVMLTRLRIVYAHHAQNGSELGGFDEAYDLLVSDLDSLQGAHVRLRERLESVAKSESESRVAIESVYADVSAHHLSTRKWLSAYSSLLRRVV